MYFISHRGNIDGSNPLLENHPEYIINAIDQGFDVEIDVWFVDKKLYLGHDEPQYHINLDFLKQYASTLWCHAKHAPALRELLRIDNLHIFSHDSDPVVFTSKGLLWAYPGQPIDDMTVCVMPERVDDMYSVEKLRSCKGICSDFIQKYRDMIS